MFDNFVVAVSAVVPLFLLMFIGVCIKKFRWLEEEELVHMNRMVFRVFFFCMMFYNIYTTEIATVFRPNLMLFGVAGVLITFFLSLVLVPKFVSDNKKRGAIIQATFRSNFVLIGVPLVDNIFGSSALAVPTMMIAVVIPVYNVLAVFTLETFRGGRAKFVTILRGILKNPMILGALLGATFLLLDIYLPEPVLKPIRQVSAATTPVALIILGASFKGGSFRKHVKELVSCVALRLVIVPFVMLTAAVELGFRGVELVTLVALFATPCAVASFAMAQQMDSDADLAGNCVVYTSALSCITIFGWVLLLKTLNLF